jgi:chemotaxis protein methyltransferase CheR
VRVPTSDVTACSPLKASEYEKIRKLAYDTFGLDLRTGKETLVSTRLAKQIRLSRHQSFNDYYQHVMDDSTGKALVSLIDALTTNHTSFFREQAHFDFLRKTFLPELKGSQRIDIWSAACSTGEEPYSIAMCLSEELGAVSPAKVRILATDISTQVLAKAEQGMFRADRFEGVSDTRLRAFWLRGERDWAGWYRVKKDVRALVEFRRFNLLGSEPVPGRFRLIFCRNVMIYFDKATQQKVVQRLAGCLEPGGYLLTGHAESLTGIDHGLEYIQPAVFRNASRDGRKTGRL